MFAKKDTYPTLRHMEFFQEANMYIPTRTVYFGGDSYHEDVVNSCTVSKAIKNLHMLEHSDPGETISIILNSCGGSWDDGIALYDVIKSLQSPVVIIGMGKVYSMGSIILQAGDIRVLTNHTTMLIHDGTEGYIGSPKSFEAWGERSKITREQSYNIYYNQMVKKDEKITIKKIEALCSHDTILTAEEAIKIGLADEMLQNITKELA
jgi:ATP-dependent Clp protease protease subunit